MSHLNHTMVVFLTPQQLLQHDESRIEYFQPFYQAHSQRSEETCKEKFEFLKDCKNCS